MRSVRPGIVWRLWVVAAERSRGNLKVRRWAPGSGRQRPSGWTPPVQRHTTRWAKPADGGRAMRVGLFVTLETEASYDVTGHLGAIREQIRAARDAGFDSLWLPQHFITGPTMRQFAAS